MEDDKDQNTQFDLIIKKDFLVSCGTTSMSDAAFSSPTTFSNSYVRLSEFIFLISWLVVWAIKSQEMVKKCQSVFFQRCPQRCLFCPQPKNIQFTVSEEERNQEIFTLKKLESEELIFFPFLKNDSNWWTDYQNRWWLIYSWKLINRWIVAAQVICHEMNIEWSVSCVCFKSKIITFFLDAPRKTLFDCLTLTACGL